MPTVVKIRDSSFFLVRWWQMWVRSREVRRNLIADARARNEPRYKLTIVGKITDGSSSYGKHRWDLYETDNGKRSVKHTDMVGYGGDQTKHPVHYQIIMPWLHGIKNINYEKTRNDTSDTVWWAN